MLGISFENFLKPADSGIFREIPLSVPGKLFTSPMPTGAYDTGKKLFSIYKKHHVEHVFPLVTDRELARKSRSSLLKEYKKRGITYTRYIIKDFQAPSLETIKDLVDEAGQRLEKGERVLIHCHAGVGRTSLAVACIVITVEGLPVQKAIDYVKEHMVVNITKEQIELVEKFEKQYHPHLSSN